MAMTPEGKVKAALVRRLNAEGWPYNTVTTHGRGRSGHPDFTVNARGRYVLVETKVDKPTPTPLQHNELARHAHAGALGFVLARAGVRIYAPVLGNQHIEVETKSLEEGIDLIATTVKQHL